MNRNEMKPEYTWDFSHIYENREAWEAEYKRAEELIAAIAPVAGTLGQSADAARRLREIHGRRAVC